MVKKLALFGGEKIRKEPFPPHPIIGEEEKGAVMEVLQSGNLSSFLAAPGKYFLGGKRVRKFEELFSDYHGVKYAVAFNSATAALHAAVVACGVKPLEEIIVPPYTFTSTATCALMNNSIPVFVDIKSDTFNIDPEKIEENISPLTKAVIPVHLFGHPTDMDEIMAIARKYNLKVIEDCAQAPGAIYKNRLVGTIGDCGIFSFTENKNITCGEGGMLITNDEKVAEIARLVRNHGEAVIAEQPRTYRSTILGWNYRLTEVDAAIGIEQFKKMDYFNNERIKLANYLTFQLQNFEGLTPPYVYEENKHVYYVYALKYDELKVGILRNRFVDAINAEGIPFSAGYIKPLYFNPIYHDNKPYIYKHYAGNANYKQGLCPVAEECHFNTVITNLITRPPANEKDMDDVVKAIKKILDNKNKLS